MGNETLTSMSRIFAHEGSEMVIQRAILEYAAGAKIAKGCNRLDVYEGGEGDFVFIEEWEDVEAVLAFRKKGSWMELWELIGFHGVGKTSPVAKLI